MEIKTCEEYVINRARELENEVLILKDELEAKNRQIKELQETVTTYDELFRIYGEKNIFNSGEKIEAGVHGGYSDEEANFFNFIEERNGKWLKVRDYRDGAPIEGSST